MDWKEGLTKVQSLASEENYEEASKLTLEILSSNSKNDDDGAAFLPSDVSTALTTFYIHTLFHLNITDDDKINSPIQTAMEYILNWKQSASYSSSEINADYYAAEEAYCYYRLKKYDKARNICEKAIRQRSFLQSLLQSSSEDVDASTAPSCSSLVDSSGLALLHIYAQTLYRVHDIMEAMRVYTVIFTKISSVEQENDDTQDNNSNNRDGECEEILTNLLAAYCSVTNTLRPTSNDILTAVYELHYKVGSIMDGKRLDEIWSSSSANYDLAYNVATVMALYGKVGDVEVS